MESETFDESQKYYSTWAKDYTADEITFGRKRLLQKVTDVIIQHSGENFVNATILDVAAGTGMIGSFLREAGFKGKLHALDANQALLIEAEKTAAYDFIVCQKIEDRNTTLKTPNIESGYDFIICLGAMYENHLPSATVDIVESLLRKGGHFVFSIVSSRADTEHGKQVQERLIDLVESGNLVKKAEMMDYEEHTPIDSSYHTILCFQKL